MDEMTGGRGVIFATGTPVSNTMTELYTMMRYLQYSTLQQKGLTHFDAGLLPLVRPPQPLNLHRKEPDTVQEHDLRSSSTCRN